MIEYSNLESERFGYRIGRWNPASANEVADPSAFDIVIVRRPAEWNDRWVDLTRFDGLVALHADSLVYWHWNRTEDRGDGVETRAVPSRDMERLASLVDDVFAGYRNHYTSNPLLDRRLALAGYVDWACRTAAEDGFLDLREGDESVGFAVIDWSVEPPDVRLAGVATQHQGRGRYRDLVVAMMSEAAARGRSGLDISTQINNVRPQRVWSRLGWAPIRAFETTHLVRESLLTGHRSVCAQGAV